MGIKNLTSMHIYQTIYIIYVCVHPYIMCTHTHRYIYTFMYVLGLFSCQYLVLLTQLSGHFDDVSIKEMSLA